MEPKNIPGAPAAIGPYCHAMRVGNLVDGSRGELGNACSSSQAPLTMETVDRLHRVVFYDRDALDLNQGVQRILLHRNRGACRSMAFKQGGIDLVHPFKIIHILQKNGRFYYVLQGNESA